MWEPCKQNRLNSGKSVIPLLKDAESRELSPQELLKTLLTALLLFPVSYSYQVQTSHCPLMARVNCFTPTPSICLPFALEQDEYFYQVSAGAGIGKGLVRATETHIQIPVLLGLGKSFFLTAEIRDLYLDFPLPPPAL